MIYRSQTGGLFKFLFFYFLFTSLLLSSYRSNAQSLVVSDFEGIEGQKGWTYEGRSELPLGEGVNGEGRALMIRTDGTKKNFSYTVPIDVSYLGRYELSFKVKTQDIEEGRGLVWINFLNEDDNKLLEGLLGQFSGTDDWQTISKTYFLGDNVKEMKVGGNLVGSGMIWFDDFSLKKVEYNPDEINLSVEAEQYIKSVVDTMQAYALYRDRIDFSDIYQIIRFYAQGAEKVEDTYEAIQRGTRYLNDHHSNYFSPEQLKEVFGDIDFKSLIDSDGYLEKEDLDLDSIKATLNFSSGRLIDGKIGYLSLVGFTHMYLDAVRMYSDSLQRIIENLDQHALAGWVIDLRKNDGGSTHAMVVSIGPLLQEDNKAYYVDAQHEPESEFYYQDGTYFSYEVKDSSSTPTPTLESKVKYQTKNKELPIAVLIGSGTASAAEGVTTVLAGEPNVKLFGTKTTGLTTGNDAIFLEDGALLNISTSFLANRNNEVYERGIEPDVEVASSEEDAVLQTALEWIYSQ